MPQSSTTIQPTHAPLEALAVRDLTYRYPDSDNGITNINFTLSRGGLTVITGRIGSGKSTLLRVLLGLLPRNGGEIVWNGQPIADPATFMVPPQVAYTPQLPVLFSESVRENILLGLDEKNAALPAALRSAIFEPDIAQLAQGLETVVGPRGVKLSGGQQQRTAAARMFVRPAELLIFDDLSSALDVHTEQALWDQLLVQHKTSLAVSNRRAVLQRADHVILLKDGRVEDCGVLGELLGRSGEMGLIWDNTQGIET